MKTSSQICQIFSKIHLQKLNALSGKADIFLTENLSWWLRKICQNTDFLWLTVYSRVREYSLHGNIWVWENTYSGIFYTVPLNYIKILSFIELRQINEKFMSRWFVKRTEYKNLKRLWETSLLKDFQKTLKCISNRQKRVQSCQ